jgi:hypothetical protein
MRILMGIKWQFTCPLGPAIPNEINVGSHNILNPAGQLNNHDLRYGLGLYMTKERLSTQRKRFFRSRFDFLFC